MSDKVGLGKKKGYFKIHVAVNKTKEILELEVTDEKVHGGKSNSIVSSKNNTLRNKGVRQQTKDLLKWKKERIYIDIDRWPKQYFHLSRECLMNMQWAPDFIT